MHRTIAGTIVAIGLAAAPEAKAWIDLEFTQKTTRTVWLTCDANYPAPCVGGTRGGWLWWNPLDGDRYSKYTLWFEGKPVEAWMYDRRVGCSRGSGWGRGWSWHVWLRPSSKTGNWKFGPLEVCSGGGGGTERMKIHVYDAPGGYQFEIRGDAPPGSRPGIRFYFSPGSNVLQRVAF